jgi:putative polyhydroxyalkanoate system protein
MAGFRLQKPYSMPEEDVREAAAGLAMRLEREHGVRTRWQGDSVVMLRGTGIDGKLSFDDGKIDVSVKLGFLAAVFQGVLRSEVQRYLDEHIT